MGDRTVTYSRFFQCDLCKNYGAYDFYGDYFCNDCIKKFKREVKEDVEPNPDPYAD